jgi:hypothetical protein
VIQLAWEVGHTVIVALLLWVVAGAVLVGMAVAGVAVGAWRAGRWLYGRWSASQGLEAPAEGRGAPVASEGLLRPSSPTGTPATAPSRPHSPRWSAPQDARGAFPAPHPPEPSQSHSGIPTRKEIA